MVRAADRWTVDRVEAEVERVRNWGRWGEDDELGTLNFVTPESIRAAVSEIQLGEVFSLAIELGKSGPQVGPLPAGKGVFNPKHWMLMTGTDADPNGYAADVMLTPLHGATHWDALGHSLHNGYMWNGYEKATIDIHGARKGAVTVMRDRMVGRGVLMDMPRLLDVETLAPGHAIHAGDLEACLESQGVEVRPADFLLVRTGQLGKCLRDEEWGEYAGGDAPGLATDTARWLRDASVAGIATDTWGVDVRPNDADLNQPWHKLALPEIGLAVGEMFNLEDLAEACASDGRYTFFFTAPPLPIEGGTGSPVNPLAIR